MTKIFFPKPDKNKTKKLLDMAEPTYEDLLNAQRDTTTSTTSKAKFTLRTSLSYADSVKKNQKHLTTY